jgi:dihydrofolate synthase/folylpolyglutamate synthase
LPLRASSDALRRGMKVARLPGRFQIVSGALSGFPDSGFATAAAHPSAEPLIVLDGAHNPAGVAALRAAVGAHLDGVRVLVLTAMMRDKLTDDILKEIHAFAGGVVFTETSNERCMDAALLSGVWSDIDACNKAEAVIRDPREAYDFSVAKVRSGEYGALVVCGSLYLISELLSGTIPVAPKPSAEDLFTRIQQSEANP